MFCILAVTLRSNRCGSLTHNDANRKLLVRVTGLLLFDSVHFFQCPLMRDTNWEISVLKMEYSSAKSFAFFLTRNSREFGSGRRDSLSSTTVKIEAGMDRFQARTGPMFFASTDGISVNVSWASLSRQFRKALLITISLGPAIFIKRAAVLMLSPTTPT